MFVVYQDGAGNVTVSARYSSSQATPRVETGTQLTLLAGSGVSGGSMVANVVCANCQSWTGGHTMSLSSSSSPWIAAWKRGASIASNSASASIEQHDDTSQFKLDLTQATLASDSNPFGASASGRGSGSSGSSGNAGKGGGDEDGDEGSSAGGGNDSSGPDSGGSSAVTVESGDSVDWMTSAHGVLMAGAFVILYPLGSILMPIIGRWDIHAGWQLITFLLMWVGFGLGVKIALGENMASGTSCVVERFFGHPSGRSII